MGGVLPYKWEAYCRTNGRRIAGFPFLRSLEARKRKVLRYKWGACCRTNWRCTAVLFREVVGVGVSETLPIWALRDFRGQLGRGPFCFFGPFLPTFHMPGSLTRKPRQGTEIHWICGLLSSYQQHQIITYTNVSSANLICEM